MKRQLLPLLAALSSACLDFGTAENQYCDAGDTFCSAPRLTAIIPGSGSASGGTAVTITGAGLRKVERVTIGGAALVDAVVNGADSISGTVPALPPGVWDVVVETQYGTAILPGGFTALRGADPDAGYSDGGRNYVFVTSVSLSPATLAGVTQADGMCRDLARDAGLPGRFVAWLPSSTQSARARVGAARAWYRPDGHPAFDRIDGPVLSAPALTERGIPYTGVVFTGSTATGDASAATCGFWTSGAGETEIGSPFMEDSRWTDTGQADCLASMSFYCVGVDQAAPLLVTPPNNARRAFISAGTFAPGAGGIGDADVLCQAEARAAGLTGTYLALLATASAAAGSRFINGLNWYRPDDIPVFDTASELLGAPDGSYPIATPSLTAAGERLVSATVWTGALTPGVAGGVETCADWTKPDAGAGRSGLSGVSSAGWFSFGVVPCSAPAHVYCLQQ